MSLLEVNLKEDEIYKKFRTVVKSNTQRIDISVVMDEIKDISEIRTKSSLAFTSSKENLLKSVMTENLKAQAYRSRLSEISVNCTRISSKISIACEKLKSHITSKYGSLLKDMARTKDERNTILDGLIHTAYEFVSELETIAEMADIVIKDIDKQHYSLKLTIDALNLHVSKEHIL